MKKSKSKLIKNPTRISDLSFDDLYDEMADEWREKAERLQARRWRKLIKQQMI